ncbi:DgyrCDS13561 [Dimorphilus gyrociliatus]|uniref:DgyrCDS13561 n=1 Tax=Dimorphilus gyrociliatus TaxID=2664684 RepID=A0A7I8WB36_9ANNE|nr:DgyrCDS13561 [Dimorphilus gyrociliatus]
MMDFLTASMAFDNCRNSTEFLNKPPSEKSTKYTIVMPTYHREKLITRAVQHYSTFSNVSKIIVAWFNEQKMPTAKDIGKYLSPKSKVNLEFYWMPNFVRLRYYPYPTINTEATLNVDDDILINENSALKAFVEWKKEKNFMYGFVARSHKVIGRNLYEYVMDETVPYSFLLANNIFMHRKYTRIYQDYTRQWENTIDRWQSCEDIALSFMFADLNGSKDSAIKVKGSYKDIRDIGAYKGLSKRKGHHFQRSYCLNRYAERYKEFPLRKHSRIIK